MATDPFVGNNTFKTPDWRKTFNNAPTDTVEPEAFDLENSELFKQTKPVVGEMLTGQVPGFDAQANVSREALKAAQAQTANAQRESLMGSGLRDAGQWVDNAIATPQQQQRERMENERNLAGMRGQLSMQQQRAGVQGATSLLNLQQGGFMTREQLAQQERASARQTGLGYAGLDTQLTQTGMQTQTQKDIANLQSQTQQKIAADEIWIKQQGLNLEQAGMMGYTDANGQYVPGSLQVAAGYFGLAGQTLEMQQKELMGYVDQNGNYVPGKMQNMNAERQLEAARLYGYTNDKGEHIMGTLELQGDANQIQREGLTLEQAQLYGYEKEDGTWVKGSLEINADKLGIEIGDFQDRRNSLYGYTDDKGNVVPGALQNAATELQLQGKSVQAQTDEVYGWTDENGNWNAGKYELLSDEQKLKADTLYGYIDPMSGEYVPGTLAFDKWALTTEMAFREKGMNFDATMTYLQTLPPEQAAEIMGQIASDAGVTYVDENGEVQKGLRPLSTEQKTTMEFRDIKSRLDAGQDLTTDDVSKLLDGFDKNFNKDTWSADIGGIEIIGRPSWMGQAMTETSTGVSGQLDRYALKDDVKQWAQANTGKFVVLNDELYVVEGIETHSKDRMSTEYVLLRDPTTNNVIQWNDGNEGKTMSTKPIIKPLSEYQK